MTELPKGYDPHNPRWACSVKGCDRDGKPVDAKRLTTAAQLRFAIREPSGNIIGTVDEGQIGLCDEHLAQFLVS